MPNCNRCGTEILFLNRWWPHPALGVHSRAVACEANSNPNRHCRESFIEVEPNTFVSVFRHACPKDEPEPPKKYKPRNQVFKGDRTKFPKRSQKSQKNLEMKF